MKNNFFILIFFLFVGCTSNTIVTKKATTETPCPIVLFSAEHSKYLIGNTQPITPENIRYKAEINNYAFKNDCTINNKIFQAEISLLFIVKPNLAEKSNITLPFYMAILNENDELIDMQYYQVDGNFKGEFENDNYIETELSKTIKLQIPLLNDEEYNQNKVIVGFMLDKEKLKILN